MAGGQPRYWVNDDGSVNLRGRDGSTYSLPEADALKEIAGRQAIPMTPDQSGQAVQLDYDKAQETPGAVPTALLSATSAFSLGASDALGLGGRGRKWGIEAHPAADIVGQLAGTAALMAVPGGGPSRLAGRLAGGLVGGAAKAGAPLAARLAAGGKAANLAGRIGSAAAKAAETFATGGAELAVYGAGAEVGQLGVEESEFGEKAADRIMKSATNSFLLGAALSGIGAMAMRSMRKIQRQSGGEAAVRLRQALERHDGLMRDAEAAKRSMASNGALGNLVREARFKQNELKSLKEALKNAPETKMTAELARKHEAAEAALRKIERNIIMSRTSIKVGARAEKEFFDRSRSYDAAIKARDAAGVELNVASEKMSAAAMSRALKGDVSAEGRLWLRAREKALASDDVLRRAREQLWADINAAIETGGDAALRLPALMQQRAAAQKVVDLARQARMSAPDAALNLKIEELGRELSGIGKRVFRVADDAGVAALGRRSGLPIQDLGLALDASKKALPALQGDVFAANRMLKYMVGGLAAGAAQATFGLNGLMIGYALRRTAFQSGTLMPDVIAGPIANFLVSPRGIGSVAKWLGLAGKGAMLATKLSVSLAERDEIDLATSMLDPDDTFDAAYDAYMKSGVPEKVAQEAALFERSRLRALKGIGQLSLEAAGRRLTAVTDIRGVFHRMKSGDESSEDLRALRMIVPELHQALSSAAQKVLDEDKEWRLSLTYRQQLARWAGDRSSANVLASTQAMYRAKVENERQEKVNAKSGGYRTAKASAPMEAADRTIQGI